MRTNLSVEKMNVMTSKILGGIGALLVFLVVVPQISVFGIVPLVGLILILIALWGLAGNYKESGIFNNALYSIIIAIVGVIATLAAAVVAAVGFINAVFPNWNGDWTSLTNLNPADINPSVVLSNIGSFLGAVALAAVILFVTFILVAIFARKSLNLLANKTGVGLFRTTGILLLVGAVLTIILIGILLIWIAMLLLAIAFFTIREQPTPPQMTPPPPQAPAQV